MIRHCAPRAIAMSPPTHARHRAPQRARRVAQGAGAAGRASDAAGRQHAAAAGRGVAAGHGTAIATVRGMRRYLAHSQPLSRTPTERVSPFVP
jgi:hypothetical protein